MRFGAELVFNWVDQIEQIIQAIPDWNKSKKKERLKIYELSILVQKIIKVIVLQFSFSITNSLVTVNIKRFNLNRNALTSAIYELIMRSQNGTLNIWN